MSTQHLDDWFLNRRWRVFTEADGPDTGSSPAVSFQQGHFKVDPPGAFLSPLNSLGRRGAVLQEVDAAGEDIAGSQAAFGEAVVTKARGVYHAII